MSTQTEHYQLSLREGTDIFNPLSTNDNFTKIDELLFQGASGGLVAGTPVVSGSLLSFQGLTLAAADTVIKFKLEDSQSVSSVTFGGSTIPIVDLSGASKTLTGGFWIGYVDTNSKFRVVAYPDVVNAQTFNGEAASYYATKAGLDAVNETAGNAVSTATAAATVANQALDAAGKAGGFALTKIWQNSGYSTSSTPSGFTAGTYNFSNTPSNIKAFLIVYNVFTNNMNFRNSKLFPYDTNFNSTNHILDGPSYSDTVRSLMNVSFTSTSATFSTVGSGPAAIPLQIFAIS